MKIILAICTSLYEVTLATCDVFLRGFVMTVGVIVAINFLLQIGAIVLKP